MSANSSIEWCDATWNPVLGCSKVSEGCRNCYAIRVAHRLGANPATPQYKGLTVLQNTPPNFLNWSGEVRFNDKVLDLPLRWKKPRRIFVNSESDLFHEAIPDGWIYDVLGVIAESPQHIFQLLTKRPQRMLEFFRTISLPDLAASMTKASAGRSPYPLKEKSFAADLVKQLDLPVAKNLWLGVSVEDQKTADERIPLLLQTPAALRWISAEPLLGPIDCGSWLSVSDFSNNRKPQTRNAPLDWIVVGGESGPGARPMHPAWVRQLQVQCHAAGVPFFFKQWGAWQPNEDGPIYDGRRLTLIDIAGQPHAKYDGTMGLSRLQRVGKKAAGRVLDGREHSEFPEARA